MADHKTEEQRNFESAVASAAMQIAQYAPDQLELVDLIARDLFSGGNVDGYSAQDKRTWDQLADVPVFTRGDTTYPAKLQWRMKASRIVQIFDSFMMSKMRKMHVMASEPASNEVN